MLYRNEDGKLWLDYLRFMPFIDGMFYQCKNLHELKWLEEEIIEIVVGLRENFEERLKEEKMINLDLAGLLQTYAIQCTLIENPKRLKRKIEKLREDLKDIEKQIEEEENASTD